MRDERNRLQQSLQRLAAQIFDQLSQQNAQAKKLSRQRQRPDGLAFLQRLLESRMANRGSSSQRDDSSEGNRLAGRGAEQRSRQQNRSTAELFSADEADSEEGDLMPSAEEDLEDGNLDISSLEDSILEGRTQEDRALDKGALARNNTADSALDDLDADSLDTEDLIDFEGGDNKAGEDGGTTFEMEVPAADERLSIDEEEDLLAALEGLARRSMSMRGEQSSLGIADSSEMTLSRADEGSEEAQPLTPIHLMRQKMLLEKAVREVFKAISEEANELLQKANVMPSFPRSLLAAATESGGLGEPANAVPNVVRVSVRVMHGEALLDDDDDYENSDGDRSRRSKRSDSELDEEAWTQNGSESAHDDRFGKDRTSQDRSSRDPEDRGAKSRRPESRRSESRNSKSRRPESRNSESSRRRLRRTNRDRSVPHGRSERRSRSDRNQGSSRIIPHELIEIEALPELAAISLRLSEVEFTDPTVSAWRTRLRQKLAELKKLGVRYQKTQRLLETTQAEDAWRSSWTVRDAEPNT